ncbi:hypothetical protein AB4039_23320 [Streptomyces sp. M-16]|uniref:hypothetical protein n=1 Tax=Streptomyces sp. M-16 TaxID=3233040 RepID=UPI00224FFECA
MSRTAAGATGSGRAVGGTGTAPAGGGPLASTGTAVAALAGVPSSSRRPAGA